MSEDAIEAVDALKVKASDLIRFLSATRKSKMCNQCGEEKWVMHSDSDASPADDQEADPAPLDLDAEVIVFELSIADRQAFQPSAMLHCASCGAINLINYSVLHQWVAANPETEE